MTEIVPGVYQLKVPIPNNPLENTNVYLIRGDDGHALIDAGWNDDIALQSLHDQLAEIGVTFRDISQILVTHAHHDHYGLAGRIRELSGATIALHEIDRDFLNPQYSSFDDYLNRMEQWFRSNGVPENELPASRMFAAMRRAGATVLPDVTLSDGDSIPVGDFHLQVVWTPGHSPGHICFYERERKLLFAGDHVLSVITPNISLQPLARNNPLADFIGSLGKVRPMDVTLALPAHEQLIENLPKRIDEIIEHHEVRNQEILAALKDEPMTAFDIAGHITWMPEFGGVHFNDLASPDRRMAVSETLAHLEAMRVNDRVVRTNRKEIIYYRHA
ncbi:MAG TPA: MBL fold metallo-hydrolase [Dehalococcoidales bacterium]|nr:MBL fold metallo-hydrolase [Dehalococcoidales bacterium]